MKVGDAVTTDDVRVNAGFSFEFMFDGIPAIASKQYVGKPLLAIRDEVSYVLDQC